MVVPLAITVVATPSFSALRPVAEVVLLSFEPDPNIYVYFWQWLHLIEVQPGSFCPTRPQKCVLLRSFLNQVKK
jgi:hypothetical protein